MFDFFDEDFPLSKKQEEEAKRKLAADESVEPLKKDEPSNTSDIATTEEEPYIDLSNVTVEEPYDDEPNFREQYQAALEAGAKADDAVDDIENIYLEEKMTDISGHEDSAAEIDDKNDEENQLAEEMTPTETDIKDDESSSKGQEVSLESLDSKQTGEQAAAKDSVIENQTPQEASDESALIADALNESSETSSEDNSVQEEVNERICEETAAVSESDESGSYDEWSGFDDSHEEKSVSKVLDSAEPKTIEEIEAHLHEELKSLGEKLDSMEKTVDEMEDGDLPDGFEYEYDEQYFHEEETPAYKHPELYSKEQQDDKEEHAPKIEMTSWDKTSEKGNYSRQHPAAVKRGESLTINIPTKTAAIAAAAAAAAVLTALISKSKKKK